MSDEKSVQTAEAPQNPDRRSFFKRASLYGASASALAFAGSPALGGLLRAAEASDTPKRAGAGLTPGDREILIAAEITEALAVTTYTNIIETAPFSRILRTTIKVISARRATKKCRTTCSSSRPALRPARSQRSTIRPTCLLTRRLR